MRTGDSTGNGSLVVAVPLRDVTPGAMSSDDVERVLDAALDLAGATDRDDLFRRILANTAALIDSDVTSFNWMAPGRVAALLHPALPPDEFAEMSAIFAEHWQENPLAAYFERTADTRALTWDDVEVDSSWRSGALFRDFFVPMGVNHQLAVRLPSPPGTVAGLACNRASVPFDARDRMVLTTFGRHVFAHLGSMTEHASLRAALGQRGWRTVLVDADSRLAGAGGADVAVTDGEYLCGPLHALVERQLAMAAGDGALVPGDPDEVVLTAGRFAAFVVPSTMPPYLVFYRSLSVDEPVATDLAALVAGGLSRREAEVAARLATGATNRQIATALDISVGTVKKHVQRIFAAMGVETRTAAAATAVRLLR